MSSKLFVGGLSWNTTDQSLSEAFSEFGEVTEAKVILDRDTGRSRGFGFVTFDAPADAEKALEELDGAEIDGRSVRVNMAEDKPRRGGGGGYTGGGGNDRGGNDRGGNDRGGNDRGGGGGRDDRGRGGKGRSKGRGRGRDSDDRW